MTFDYRLDELPAFAEAFWKFVAGRTVFAFHGAMGAGKTTTIAALCRYKGVQEAVSSPTFSIINEYAYMEEGAPKVLYHMDLYRLRDLDEIIAAGVEDCLESGSICFVEWPEKAPELLKGAVEVRLEVLPEGRRAVVIVQ